MTTYEGHLTHQLTTCVSVTTHIGHIKHLPILESTTFHFISRHKKAKRCTTSIHGGESGTSTAKTAENVLLSH